jgi:hypothetical protein
LRGTAKDSNGPSKDEMHEDPYIGSKVTVMYRDYNKTIKACTYLKKLMGNTCYVLKVTKFPPAYFCRHKA